MHITLKKNTLYGVPLGMILETLLFNIDLLDLFLIINHEDIANYSDDNTLSFSEKTTDLN